MFLRKSIFFKKIISALVASDHTTFILDDEQYLDQATRNNNILFLIIIMFIHHYSLLFIAKCLPEGFASTNSKSFFVNIFFNISNRSVYQYPSLLAILQTFFAIQLPLLPI